MRSRRVRREALPLLLGLAACAGPGPEMPPPAPLEGTQWRLVRLLGEQIASVELAEAPLLGFGAEGRAGGSGGCNRFSGPWAQDGATLRLGPFAVTRRACAAHRMALEERFLGALARVERATVVGSRLELLDGEGRAIADFLPEGED